MERSIFFVIMLTIMALLFVVSSPRNTSKKSDFITQSGREINNLERTYRRAFYIYMCESTLETKNGAATKNIAELLKCDIADDGSVTLIYRLASISYL